MIAVNCTWAGIAPIIYKVNENTKLSGFYTIFKVFWRIRFCDSLILLSVDGAVLLEKKSQTNYQ